MNQSKMATDLEKREQGEQFHVMDEPNLPDAPFSPKRPVFALGGFVGGLALGLLIIAGLEYRDTSLRNETDIWVFTHLPTLATIAKNEHLVSATPHKGSTLQRLFRRRTESLPGVQG